MTWILASLLFLFFSLIALWFTFGVLRIQYPLLKSTNDPDNKALRYRLFYLALAFFVGTLVTALIDLGTIIGLLHRTNSFINATGLVFTLSYAITGALVAYLLWDVYRTVAISNAKFAAKNKSLRQANDKLNRKK